MRSLVVLVAPLLVAGCTELELFEDDDESVQESVRSQIQAYIDADADRFIAYMAPNWVDLGGGDGTPYSRQEHYADMKEYFASDEYRSDFKDVNAPEDVLQMGRATFRSYSEFMADEERFGIPERFHPEKGDIQVHIEPSSEDSPFFDGWFGYYRLIGEKWMDVAGD